MNKVEIEKLQLQIERLKIIIKSLYERPETKQDAVALSYTNQYLHELLIKELCRKDNDGNYIHQEDNTISETHNSTLMSS